MKTATVRDLRNNFARISRWVESGQEVEITKRGDVVAKLVPVAKKTSRKKRFSAAEHLKWMKSVYGDKVLEGNIAVMMREESDW